MKKELSSRTGTIANVFSKHRNELFVLIEEDKFQQLQTTVNSLLDDPSLKNNPAIEEAKRVLNKCSSKKNLYYSTLVTYMTGMKVS